MKRLARLRVLMIARPMAAVLVLCTVAALTVTLAFFLVVLPVLIAFSHVPGQLVHDYGSYYNQVGQELQQPGGPPPVQQLRHRYRRVLRVPRLTGVHKTSQPGTRPG
jgi:hypothetical protein